LNWNNFLRNKASPNLQHKFRNWLSWTVAGVETPRRWRFLSLEDETGISNVIVNPDLYEKYRVVVNRQKFLLVEGVLQNQDHTISIKASRVLPISITAAKTQMPFVTLRGHGGARPPARLSRMCEGFLPADLGLLGKLVDRTCQRDFVR
jgi:DNA polymerase III alpha subunit